MVNKSMNNETSFTRLFKYVNFLYNNTNLIVTHSPVEPSIIAN